MSLAYDIYLEKHIQNTVKGLDYILNYIDSDKLDSILPTIRRDTIYAQVSNHDSSKYSLEEYDAYDNYFYNGGHSNKSGQERFNYAWLHHIHNNPHHWQYWVLLEDDGSGKPKPMDIPDNYILEMICDWWSFSWAKHYEKMAKHSNESSSSKELYEIFNWYNDHKAKIFMTNTTKTKVEALLDLLRESLDTKSSFDDAEPILF